MQCGLAYCQQPRRQALKGLEPSEEVASVTVDNITTEFGPTLFINVEECQAALSLICGTNVRLEGSPTKLQKKTCNVEVTSWGAPPYELKVPATGRLSGHTVTTIYGKVEKIDRDPF